MKWLYVVLCLWAGVSGMGAARGWNDIFRPLDDTIRLRSYFSQQKERRIAHWVKALHATDDVRRKLLITNKIYEEYHTYRFDSAMKYINLQAQLARQVGSRHYLLESKIHRSFMLTTAGYFSESVNVLQSIDAARLSPKLRTDYFIACEWAYGKWAEYTDDDVYAPVYSRLERAYRDSLLMVLQPGTPYYKYIYGVKIYTQGRYREAADYFKEALAGTSVDHRLYAMTTYSLALVYKQLDDYDLYLHYLIRAAISDMTCPLKENLAMQELALYIFKQNNGEASRANQYLSISLEDAKFFNSNRLRMLEIARKFPDIYKAYQVEMQQKNTSLRGMLICISILVVGLLVSLYYIRRQLRQLGLQRQALEEANEQLRVLNQSLLNTNLSREHYVSLFLELCAAYIDKLNRYENLVKRKVKAHQSEDLLKQNNVTRLSATDARDFFYRFDTAFLTLYPDFIEAFNQLLTDGCEVRPKRGEILGTELRIFALVRLGISDSSRIATLLFYSPQTIYNYRTAIRKMARDREHFEQQVAGLCMLNAGEKSKTADSSAGQAEPETVGS